MRRNNISDEELDNLFRKGAESHDPPYDPEAWKAMETKLNEVAKEPSWWSKFLYPFLVLLAITTVVAVLKLTPDPAAETKDVASASEKNIQEEKQPVSRTPGTNMQLPKQAEQRDAASGLSTRQPVAGTAEKRSEPAAKTEKRSVAAGKKRAVAFTEERKTFSGVRTAASSATAASRYNQDKNTTAGGALITAATPPAATAAGLPLPDSASVSVKGDEALQQEADSIAPGSALKATSTFLSSLQISLLAAPDVTTVKLRNPDAVSANAGIVFGVPVTKKISIVTGVIWANKQYKAKPEDYAPAPDYWNGRKLPATIDATCRVLDIPLNIRYQVFERNKNSIALQAGLSSYFMLQEKYTYLYDTYNKTIEISNQNKHWFGVQNLSVAYNRKITPTVSVGIEPFVKIPLTGIGAGNVKLSSAGIFFMAGYSIPLKKERLLNKH